jgi:hypothetical protein
MTAKDFLKHEYGIELGEDKALIHPAMLIKAMETYAEHRIDERMPTEEAERWDAEDYLNTKDIWNHPMVSDRTNKNGYEVADLMAEFANEWFRSRMEEKR